MTTTHIEVTLEQMLQLALGTPKISSINLSILHSFFDILLKKLDCQYEKMQLDGLDGACLQSILHKSRISPLPFKVEKIEVISDKLKKLARLKERQLKFADQLEQHIEYVHKCNSKRQEASASRNWEEYSGPCETFCEMLEPSNELFCKLLNDSNFIKKCKQIIEEPLIGPIIDMRKRVEVMHVDLLDYQRRYAEKCERLAYIEALAKEIEKFTEVIVIEKQSFMRAMAELQDMIDGKMDKVVLPALRKYIENETEKIRNVWKILSKSSSCPKSEELSVKSGTCLSCTGKLTCTQRPILIASERRCDAEENKKRKSAQTGGRCFTRSEEKKQLDELKRIEEAKISKEMSKSCNLISDHLEVFQGTNGIYYRKA
ncbi:uncharacterized protein LOC128861377 [Anastrepha ludens]|uniref:uncharacterized protein LOC128861377 n=1 Tax=Anastrepha ludens TaxID=28586 RepID=UPI0023AEED5B|nr:uncharacterized protein LOC128861377 [Anastrepha ludens]